MADSALGAVPADWDADRAVTALYSTHYRSLVRLSALLLRDVATAEEVVQDSFVAMHDGWRRLRDSEKALSYLRQSVVNRSRSVLRHRVVVDRNAPKPPPDMPSAEQGAFAQLERSAVVTALRTLPARQREALVLRYYGDLVGGADSDGHGYQQGGREEPYGQGDVRAPQRAGAGRMKRTRGATGQPGAESMTYPTVNTRSCCAARCAQRQTRSSRRVTAWSGSAPGSGRRARRSRPG